MTTALTPIVTAAQRLELTELGGGVARVCLRFGFIETPDVPLALQLLAEPPKILDTTFVLSRQTLIPSDKPGM